jgi:hypothetical protein
MAEEDDLRKLAADPTPLTTAMLLREIANLSEKVGIRIDGLEKAQNVFEANLTRVPTEVQKEVGNLKALHEQRFSDFENQLKERSDRRASEKKAADDALAAALAGQKELAASQDSANAAAISKSQDATDKQIDSIKALVGAGFKTVDEKIGLINSRLDRGEGSTGGVRDRNTERRQDTHLLVAIGSMLLAAVAIAFAVFRHAT